MLNFAPLRLGLCKTPTQLLPEMVFSRQDLQERKTLGLGITAVSQAWFRDCQNHQLCLNLHSKHPLADSIIACVISRAILNRRNRFL